MLGLLLDAESPSRTIELHNSVTFWVVHRISKHARSTRFTRSLSQVLAQIVPIENVVAQYQRASAGAKKFLSHQKSLRNSLRLGLHFVLQPDSKLASIPQQCLKLEQILRSSNKKDLANPRQHQRAQRVINHGFVV